MPTPEQALCACLKGDAPTTALLPGGIYPDQGPENAVNWLAFQVVSSYRPKLLNGAPAAIRCVRFQLTARLDKRVDAGSVRTAIENLLDGQVNATLGGLTVKSSRLSDDEGAVDEDEGPRPGEESGNRVVRMDLIWWL